MGWAAAAPIIGAAVGGGASIYAEKKRADAQKKAMEKAEQNRFLFSPEERDIARNILMRQLTMSLPMAPRPGTQGVPRNASPQQIMFAQFMKMVMDRYARPTLPYQGFLAKTQERRDARAGVAQPPPQGAQAPSAQRQNSSAVAGYGGGRSY